ncbi:MULTISPECIES: phosphodiesterase [Aliivibrio]|uniref:Phosphoesterase n=1 Tax=Aliivibrio finisterrensis TaxID=511998 RepID=A0A4V1Z7Z7_9GAMM|nr:MULTISPECIES: phosphodiesterase [Aliivibrio]MDD9173264.1 phosphodiesterase [Aliivibrio sp. S3TY1]MDD9178940.1 phosphodiesterase [Aliivibrio sp. A6]MDD9190340.1 phosphodiesterase [Aliivibrio sp. S2TY2]RYU47150.1 phosphodiesterase [Aliivibrio finisterrensis]RYU51786.1 phosphodiesterase [Aliivibrio finisterrensis]
MKLFFASDLHGSLTATQRMIDAFTASKADHLILLGDLINFGPRNPIPEGHNPIAVAELLNQYAESIIAVRGNCDSEVDQMLLSFPIMSDYNIVLLPTGQKLFLTHGHIYNADKRPLLKKGDIIVHGHTHITVAEWQGEQIIFNPGSTTFPRNEDGKPSYGLLDDSCLSVLDFDGNVLNSIELK